jgi:hypothetical protein
MARKQTQWQGEQTAQLSAFDCSRELALHAPFKLFVSTLVSAESQPPPSGPAPILHRRWTSSRLLTVRLSHAPEGEGLERRQAANGLSDGLGAVGAKVVVTVLKREEALVKYWRATVSAGEI